MRRNYETVLVRSDRGAACAAPRTAQTPATAGTFARRNDRSPSPWTLLTSNSARAIYRASPLTVGPWNPDHQHAGPPSALICRAVERAAARDGLTHLGRLTVNLLRPAPVGECRVEIGADYIGRNAGHFSGRLTADGKEIARFTALMQREEALPVPDGTPGHPAPQAPKPVDESPVVKMPFVDQGFGYADLVENRLAAGKFFDGPCAAWFRMNHPLVKGEEPSPYQRVAVAADSGNGISAALDFKLYVFVNCDLTINLFRRPAGNGSASVGELVRRRRLRPGRVGALRRAGPDRAGAAKVWSFETRTP